MLTIARYTAERLRNLAIERFRINVIVSSKEDAPQPLEAWEEDAWTHLEVFDKGSTPPMGLAARGKGVGIDCNAHCGRCLVPSVDLETVSSGALANRAPRSLIQWYRRERGTLIFRTSCCKSIVR